MRSEVCQTRMRCQKGFGGIPWCPWNMDVTHPLNTPVFEPVFGCFLTQHMYTWSGVSLARHINTVSTVSWLPNIVLNNLIWWFIPEQPQKIKIKKGSWAAVQDCTFGGAWESHTSITAKHHSPTNVREWGAVEMLVEADNQCPDPNYNLEGGLGIYSIVLIVK